MYGFELPKDFLIGTATSAFQCEGAADRDGKSESIMDHYAKLYAGKPAPEYSPEEGYKKKKKRIFTTDLPDNGYFYDHYEEYIDEMKETGQNTYRMSIAWTRILPEGTGRVNQRGIDFYNRVINKLIACGIMPFVDLYHWDLPQCLMDKGGFANPDFPDWFEEYARVCFEAFGDRVKMWSTFNESAISIISGYVNKRFPPFLEGNKTGQLAGHNCILAHYRAVRAYKEMKLDGKIGAVNCIADITPAYMKKEDIGAVARQMQRHFDWWAEPMMKGTYPRQLIRECPYICNNMPEHYQEDLDHWFIPMDFMGLNYYVSNRTGYNPDMPLLSDRVESFYAAPGQSYAGYPAGLFDVVWYVKQRYYNPEIYITENGCAMPNINDKEKECNDQERIGYIREHLRTAVRLIHAGVNLRGYYYWSDVDTYEEMEGYRLRFGLTWFDHKTGDHQWKKSRYYFSDICRTHLVN